jgi:hypothetical protein
MKFKRHSDFFADQDCTGELVPVESADRLLTLPKGSQVFWCWCVELSFGISRGQSGWTVILSRVRGQAVSALHCTMSKSGWDDTRLAFTSLS